MRRLSSSILASGILLTFASSLKADTTVEAGTKIYYSDQVPISSFSDDSGVDTSP